MRSEAQKRADKKYKEKNKNKYAFWGDFIYTRRKRTNKQSTIR